MKKRTKFLFLTVAVFFVMGAILWLVAGLLFLQIPRETVFVGEQIQQPVHRVTSAEVTGGNFMDFQLIASIGIQLINVFFLIGFIILLVMIFKFFHKKNKLLSLQIEKAKKDLEV